MKTLDSVFQRWRIAKAIPHIPKGGRLLDIGSADGRLFEILGRRIKEGLGIDPLLSEPVACARYCLIPGQFPEEVPKSETFDVITMLAVLEHFPKDILKHCGQICSSLLRSGGYIIITVPSKYVDNILVVLKCLRLVDACTLDEHYGFEVSMISDIFSNRTFELVYKEKFQLGLNNLFVYQKK